jgi:hypothetical protein
MSKLVGAELALGKLDDKDWAFVRSFVKTVGGLWFVTASTGVDEPPPELYVWYEVGPPFDVVISLGGDMWLYHGYTRSPSLGPGDVELLDVGDARFVDVPKRRVRSS